MFKYLIVVCIAVMACGVQPATSERAQDECTQEDIDSGNCLTLQERDAEAASADNESEAVAQGASGGGFCGGLIVFSDGFTLGCQYSLGIGVMTCITTCHVHSNSSISCSTACSLQ